MEVKTMIMKDIPGYEGLYAATDEAEFFAETFTMYVKGETLPDYIKSMIEKVLNDGIL